MTQQVLRRTLYVLSASLFSGIAAGFARGFVDAPPWVSSVIVAPITEEGARLCAMLVLAGALQKHGLSPNLRDGILFGVVWAVLHLPPLGQIPTVEAFIYVATLMLTLSVLMLCGVIFRQPLLFAALCLIAHCAYNFLAWEFRKAAMILLLTLLMGAAQYFWKASRPR